MITRYLCPYDGCEWTLDIPDSTYAALMPRLTDACIKSHLDAAHPHWTVAELVELQRQRSQLPPPEPDVPWVMVGRVVWWASIPHDQYPSWVCSSRDGSAPTSHEMTDWATLWAYAIREDLPVVMPGEALR